jgi:hypothetical protein
MLAGLLSYNRKQCSSSAVVSSPSLPLRRLDAFGEQDFSLGRSRWLRCQSLRWFCIASRSLASDYCLSSFFERPHLAGSEWGWVFAASVLGVPVQYLVQFKGLSLTTVSHASLMVGTLPMLLAIAAVVAPRRLAGARRLDNWCGLDRAVEQESLWHSTRQHSRRHAGCALDVCGYRMDSDLEATHAATFCRDGHGSCLLDRHCDSLGCCHYHIRRSFFALLQPCMDCGSRAGNTCDRVHNDTVELGAQAGSSIASRNLRKFGTGGWRDSWVFPFFMKCWGGWRSQAVR